MASWLAKSASYVKWIAISLIYDQRTLPATKIKLLALCSYQMTTPSINLGCRPKLEAHLQLDYADLNASGSKINFQLKMIGSSDGNYHGHLDLAVIF